MKQRVSAVIIDKTKILLMYRFKIDKGEYFVMPGGTVEDGETLIDALKREVKEETNLDIEEFEKITEISGYIGKTQLNHVYKISKYTGIPEIIGEELEKNCDENKYELRWIELRDLHKLNLKPDKILESIF